MQPFPHHYNVYVTAEETNSAQTSSRGLRPLATAPPAEFGGPGNLWSPETLFVAAAANCLVFTFRAVASASKFRWTSIDCDGTGVLDRTDGVTRFTAIQLRARLRIPAGADAERGRILLEKAEKACLIANSLNVSPALDVEITFEEPALAPTA
jgi:organic hydroperoxide reductase OsmC/OhrA